MLIWAGDGSFRLLMTWLPGARPEVLRCKICCSYYQDGGSRIQPTGARTPRRPRSVSQRLSTLHALMLAGSPAVRAYPAGRCAPATAGNRTHSYTAPGRDRHSVRSVHSDARPPRLCCGTGIRSATTSRGPSSGTQGVSSSRSRCSAAASSKVRHDRTFGNSAAPARTSHGIAKLSASIRNEVAGPSWVDDARACHLPRIPLSG